jgi:hypothetical protein
MAQPEKSVVTRANQRVFGSARYRLNTPQNASVSVMMASPANFSDSSERCPASRDRRRRRPR